MAAPVDRQTTTPFLLRLFYKQGSFHRLEEFTPQGRLPQHLQIYTWPTCTLSELSHLLLSAIPSLLPAQYAGTRIAFRIVHPDMSVRGNATGRYIGRDLGSVIVGAATSADEEVAKSKDENGDVDMKDGDDEGRNGEEKEKDKDASISLAELKEALKDLSGDPQKALSAARFVTGDYICCAVLPPLADGSVAAPPPPVPSGPSSRPPPRDGFGAGRGGRGGMNGYRGDGYRRGIGGGDGQRGGRPGAGIGYDDWRRDGGGGVPSGEWRRGEAPPEGYWRGGSNDGRLGGPGGGGGRGGGRGRGRW